MPHKIAYRPTYGVIFLVVISFSQMTLACQVDKNKTKQVNKQKTGMGEQEGNV